ncbi:MAG: rhodanese-like domain-containing protein [Anaerolineales bacterium]
MLSRQWSRMVLLFSLWLAACGVQSASAPSGAVSAPIKVDGGAYTNVAPSELSEMLKHKDFLFVNTHIPYEGELEQTDAFIAFEENGPQRVSEYPADRSAKIVLYCRSGRMSAIVANELMKAGYTNVWNLDGGMIEWEKAGYTVIRK